MKINSLFFALLICTIFLLGCNRQTEIKGEVFTVRDSQIIKLGAIPVKIIKKEKAGKLFGDPTLPADADYFTTTDSDGKFSIKVPKGEYVIAADFYLNETDISHYYWRVPFRADIGEKKIALDQTNIQPDFTERNSP